MSRFFRSAVSDSSEDEDFTDYSSSEEVSEEFSENEQNDQRQQEQQQQKKSLFSKYLADSDSDADSENKRVVRSGKEKYYDELRGFVDTLKAHMGSNDYIQIQQEFDKVTKFVTQNKKYSPLKIYFKFLGELEEYIVSENAQDKKKLDNLQAKALTAMAQKIKKYNKSYQDQIEDAKNAPVESPVKQEKQPVKEKTKSRFLKSVGSRSEEEESSDEEEESSDEETPAVGINRWKKTVPVVSDKKADIKKPAKSVAFQTNEQSVTLTNYEKPSSAQKITEISSETVYVKLREIMEARGKKGTDKLEQVVILEKVFEVAKSPIQKVKVLMALISARFDMSSNPEMWKSALKEVEMIFKILEENNNIKVQETGEEFDDENPATVNNEVKIVRGNPVSLIIRLDEDFTKNLQAADSNSNEYLDRLIDEIPLYALIIRAENYCQGLNDKESISRLRMLRLEHIYYKYNDVIKMMEESTRKIKSSLGPVPSDVEELISDLCVFLYNNANERLRTRAILCHVYHHALNQRFSEARDLFLMSHLQDSIQRADIPTQVLYNRALAQIGICAFRSGLIQEAHNALNDIMASLKTKDLLAQGSQSQRYQATEIDRKEKYKLLPFHMHINLELLEAIQLTVSMLLEIPSIASNVHDSKKRIISKHFRRLYDTSEKQIFSGPPENFKDSIMQASKALSMGEWKKANDLICSVSSWNLIPKSSEIKTMLNQKIKEAGLGTYLFSFGPYYECIGIDYLSSSFELDDKNVIEIVSKMIFYDEFSAHIEGSNIIVHQEEVTRSQYLTQQLIEKVNSLVEGNEKLYDMQRFPARKEVKQQ